MENILSERLIDTSESYHFRACGCSACKATPGNSELEVNSQGTSTGGGRLTTDFLTSQTFSDHTQAALNGASGEVLSFYIAQDLGRTWFDDYTYGQSLGHSAVEADFARNIFTKIDEYIDLDFEEKSSPNSTTFDIYCLSSYSEWEIGRASCRERV